MKKMTYSIFALSLSIATLSAFAEPTLKANDNATKPSSVPESLPKAPALVIENGTGTNGGVIKKNRANNLESGLSDAPAEENPDPNERTNKLNNNPNDLTTNGTSEKNIGNTSDSAPQTNK